VAQRSEWPLEQAVEAARHNRMVLACQCGEELRLVSEHRGSSTGLTFGPQTSRPPIPSDWGPIAEKDPAGRPGPAPLRAQEPEGGSEASH
jgi:hypothetical protein